MTLEVNQIKASSEAAIGSNAEKPNFTEVYKELSNNTTAQEQKAERTAFNEVLHQQFPTLDLVGQDRLQSEQGEKDALVVFDRTNNHVQLRSADDFSVVAERDMSAKVEENKVTSEQASEFLASVFDKAIEEKANANPTSPSGSPESLPPASPSTTASPETLAPSQPNGIDEVPNSGTVSPSSDQTASPSSDQTVPPVSDTNASPASEQTNPETNKEQINPSSETNAEQSAEQKKDVTDQSKEKTYIVENGDCLWNIAKAELKAAHDQSGEVTNASIRNYVDKIVERNRKEIKDEDLIYPGQKFILPSLKQPDEKQKPEERANTGEKPAEQTGDGNIAPSNQPLPQNGDGTTRRLDAPPQSRPDAQTVPNDENMFDDKRNSIPDQPPAKM
ncbi:MAG: LysM peptidoglycan-binding domain-containing protein [Candidatus Melainabacteria bacterium]|nr:LysM peptidoglycan-binding domain-containing protein [Candidatus Melainabacteria bacterium]